MDRSTGVGPVECPDFACLLCSSVRSKLALDEGDFVIAERCYSALGDVSKRAFM